MRNVRAKCLRRGVFYVRDTARYNAQSNCGAGDSSEALHAVRVEASGRSSEVHQDAKILKFWGEGAYICEEIDRHFHHCGRYPRGLESCGCRSECHLSIQSLRAVSVRISK